MSRGFPLFSRLVLVLIPLLGVLGLLALGDQVDGLVRAAFGAGRVRIILPDNIDLRQIYRTAADHAVQIRRMNYRRDSLEDIFLKAMAGQPAAASVQQGSTNGRL